MSKILSDWSTSHNGLLGHKTDSVTNYQTSMMVEWLTNWPPIVSSQFKLHDIKVVSYQQFDWLTTYMGVVKWFWTQKAWARRPPKGSPRNTAMKAMKASDSRVPSSKKELGRVGGLLKISGFWWLVREIDRRPHDSSAGFSTSGGKGWL